ncbi:MAG TPA: fatty acid desaturase [Polyangiaceae bacterium]|jgi:fatty acid desaturase
MNATANPYPIPARLNVALSIAQVAGALALVAAASHAPNPLLFGLAVLAFAFWMQMGFSLLHEAEHNKLHPRRAVNDALGIALAALFPGSYQLLKVAHLSHHKKNRSDAELVDYVRPSEGTVGKWVQFYALVCGLVWIGVPLLTLIVVVVPWGLLGNGQSPDVQPTGGPALYLAFVREVGAWRVRGEAALTVAFGWGAFHFLHLTWPAVLACYAAFAFSWSSQQYIYHVRSPRHLVEGAFNLRLWKPLELLYLHFNYHLTHHRAVSLPWIHLPRATREAPTMGYLETYVRLWAPPQPVAEAWPVEFQGSGRLAERP